MSFCCWVEKHSPKTPESFRLHQWEELGQDEKEAKRSSTFKGVSVVQANHFPSINLWFVRVFDRFCHGQKVDGSCCCHSCGLCFTWPCNTRCVHRTYHWHWFVTLMMDLFQDTREWYSFLVFSSLFYNMFETMMLRDGLWVTMYPTDWLDQDLRSGCRNKASSLRSPAFIWNEGMNLETNPNDHNRSKLIDINWLELFSCFFRNTF